MLRRHFTAIALLLLATANAAAQAAPTAPATKPARRSLADGLVRQRIELDRITPPTLRSGDELAQGQGDLVLLVRRRDGTIEPFELQRGLGDHGLSRPPVRAEERVEVVEEEIEQQEAPAEPAKGDAPQAKGAKKAAAAPPNLRPAKTPTLRVLRKSVAADTDAAGDAATAAETTATHLLCRLDHHRQVDLGAEPDLNRLRPLLEKQAKRLRGTKVEGVLVLELDSEVTMQDMLQISQLARSTGFETLQIGGSGYGAAGPETRSVLNALPERFGWDAKGIGPQRMLKIYDGELLILLDGPTTWAEFAPIYVHCSKLGIWRIAIVGQAGVGPRGNTTAGTAQRFKLPIPIPFDRGL
ncbi:MAG: hypothetical protein AB8H80_15415 [Planctomycetota bacterium]